MAIYYAKLCQELDPFADYIRPFCYVCAQFSVHSSLDQSYSHWNCECWFFMTGSYNIVIAPGTVTTPAKWEYRQRQNQWNYGRDSIGADTDRCCQLFMSAFTWMPLCRPWLTSPVYTPYNVQLYILCRAMYTVHAV